MSNLIEIAAVIFDLDGVLVDSEPIHFRAANHVLSRYGLAIDEATYITFIGLGEEATWAAWKEHMGIAESVESLLAAHTLARLEEIRRGVPAIESAGVVVRALSARGVPLAIASSSTPAVIDALLGELGLDEAFPIRVSGEDPEVHASKPAPDVFLVAARRLGVNPTACIAVEDSGPGVTAAKRAGMFCVAVPNRWTAAQSFRDADVILESLRYFPLLVA